MRYLLFGGAPSTGKTSAIYRLAIILTTRAINPFIIVAGSISLPPPFGKTPNDFKVLLEGVDIKGKKTYILINSATDDKYNIDLLKDFYNNQQHIDIIISSVRDIYWKRKYFFETMKILLEDDFYLEIPLAKITRRNDHALALNWYNHTLDTLGIHILSNTPFNL